MATRFETPAALVDEAVWRATLTLAGEVLQDDDELRAFRTGLDDAEWNGVHRARTRPGTTAARLRARATELFAGTPFTWHLGATSTPDVEPALAGLPFEEQEPGMVADLSRVDDAPPTSPDGVELLPVTTGDELATWVEVLTGGRPDRGLAEVRRPAALGGPAPHVLAVAAGRAVGCAAVFLTDPAAVVDHVVTASDARNRGIGTLLTRWALTTARQAGHRTAALTASPSGQSIYTRLGFRPVSIVRRYRSA